MSDIKTGKDNPYHKDYGVWKNTKYMLGKIRQYEKRVLGMIAVTIVASSILSIFWGVVGKYVIDLVQTEGQESEKITELAILIVGLFLIAFLLQFFNTNAGQRSNYLFIKIRMDMINERVKKVLHIPYELLEKPEVLDIYRRCTDATNGNNNGTEGMMRKIPELGIQLFTAVMTFVSVLVLDWRMILVMTASCLIQFACHCYIIRVDKKQVWDVLAPIWRRIGYLERNSTNFDAAKDIRLFRMQGFIMKKNRDFYGIREERIDHHQNLWLSYSFISQVFSVITNLFIYYVLVNSVLDNGLTIGNFTMYLSFATAFSSSLTYLLQQFGDYNRASLEVDDFRSFLDLELADTTACRPIPVTDRYTFVFENVSYKYTKAETYALKNLNLTLAPGEKLAVVGLNGAGKTTMIKLLLRLYDPTEGHITLNGVDIREFDREEYYRLFAPVFQDLQVMAFPVSENVSMKPAEQTDEKKAMKCIVQAGLGDKINSLPNGIKSNLLKVMEDDGVDLSGGEKQKLALARALYKGAPVVVLDEPTSALDAIAEQHLYETFDEMIGEKSAVYISHRLASTRFCDHIAMFRNGEMVEYGDHASLMELNGEYASMFTVQAQYYREKKGGESDV